MSAPSGDQTAVADAAAAFGDLTAQQIAGLGDDGFDALASTSGSLALDVSQGLAAAAADLSGRRRAATRRRWRTRRRRSAT